MFVYCSCVHTFHILIKDYAVPCSAVKIGYNQLYCIAIFFVMQYFVRYKGWELKFLIRAFGLSQNLSTKNQKQIIRFVCNCFLISYLLLISFLNTTQCQLSLCDFLCGKDSQCIGMSNVWKIYQEQI